MSLSETHESRSVKRTAADFVDVFDQLSSKPCIDIAVDTEFEGSRTLTVQTAANFGQSIRVQLYRSDLTPSLPKNLPWSRYVPNDCPPLEILPVARITSILSPARILLRLWGICRAQILDRAATLAMVEGRGAWVPANATWDEAKKRWKVPAINIRLIGHLLPADLCHLFGSHFFASIFDASSDGRVSPLCLPKRKLVTLASSPTSFRPPIVEAILAGESAYPLNLEFRDTSAVFGNKKLDYWCLTFLGSRKSTVLTAADKENMLGTFRERPADAFGYAASDVVSVLRIYERMEQVDRDLYRSFSVPTGSIPAMHGTIGRRISDFLFTLVQKAARGSAVLRTDRELKKLMRMGGRRPFASRQSPSRFGCQTATIHGGLLYTRSPTRFWHEAPGQLRDVDISGCYTEILGKINMYIGRPVLVEPGQNKLTVKAAVEFMRRHAPDDGWFLRVLPRGTSRLCRCSATSIILPLPAGPGPSEPVWASRGLPWKNTSTCRLRTWSGTPRRRRPCSC